MDSAQVQELKRLAIIKLRETVQKEEKIELDVLDAIVNSHDPIMRELNLTRHNPEDLFTITFTVPIKFVVEVKAEDLINPKGAKSGRKNKRA